MRTLRAATGAVLLPPSLAAPASAGSPDARVPVLHGVPGLTVDGHADGDAILTDPGPGTMTDPLTLPAGDHELEVVPAEVDRVGWYQHGPGVGAPEGDAVLAGHVGTVAGGPGALVVARP